MESSEAKLKLSGILDDSTSKVRLKRKKKNGPVEPRRAALLEGEGLESASVSSLTDRDVTIDVLVNILQDPDKGVPRSPVSAIKANVQIRKGLFLCFYILLDSCL